MQSSDNSPLATPGDRVRAGSEVRKRRSRSARRSGALPILADPRFGRWLLLAMIAAAIAYAGSALWTARMLANTYSGLVLGMPRADVRYFMGPPPEPARGADSAPVWTYRADTATTRVHFDGAGRISRIACSDEQASVSTCPDTMGLGLGTAEDVIWSRLGAPTEQSYAGDTKLLYYRDLGLQFALRRFQVVGIALGSRPSRLSYLPRAARLMLP